MLKTLVLLTLFIGISSGLSIWDFILVRQHWGAFKSWDANKIALISGITSTIISFLFLYFGLGIGRTEKESK